MRHKPKKIECPLWLGQHRNKPSLHPSLRSPSNVTGLHTACGLTHFKDSKSTIALSPAVGNLLHKIYSPDGSTIHEFQSIASSLSLPFMHSNVFNWRFRNISSNAPDFAQTPPCSYSSIWNTNHTKLSPPISYDPFRFSLTAHPFLLYLPMNYTCRPLDSTISQHTSIRLSPYHN